MANKLAEKVASLPFSPGVYIYKDQSGAVIYVGKAAKLRSRVQQYFQKSRVPHPKTDALVAEINDFDWLEVESEMDALFLESELVKRYMPKYNILLRDDKHYQYVRIDFKSDHPTVQVVRRPVDDGAEYFGPYVGSITPALKLLRRIFPFDYKVSGSNSRSRLQADIGMSPGLESGKTTLEEYIANLRKLAIYLRGNRTDLEKQITKEMKHASESKEFELAARKRNQLAGLNNLHKQIVFGKNEFFDTSKDLALNALQDLLELKTTPRRIEGYDISHQSGSNNVASMVVFTDGISDKREYRKFKMRIPGNNDFAHMNEVINRRFAPSKKNWPKPDLLLIDGGKGQLGAALEALAEAGVEIPAIGLAKRYETIIIPKESAFEEVVLPKTSHLIMLLQRIRDESHRFAVSYHTNLKRNAGTKSILDTAPGIGPVTRKKLINSFGSVRAIKSTNVEAIAEVIGSKKAKQLHDYLNANN